MAGIFDYIPAISIAMFVLGIAGVMAYEWTKAKTTKPKPRADGPPS
ncbi:MAG: hypothetical protein MPJ05_01640 [Nitrosopumilus sp.]|nr:hypothetical protein [Nitrosopumilus sp.]CAI9831699.1 conserved hypothetical protein [Nitrosopumilaceae archaeon]MDA7941004.1 hypothetical protein [Nitrosopumilus sp.]MDA7942598.1 hypothetical protein [Nitrosopumilus sp.]MDA7944436.1 hypothetical protein [Nitrosopumilus sp.]